MLKRVLVTRAVHQASAFGDALAARGLLVVSIPAIAMEEPADGFASLHDALERLDEFDWILFTSANAVAVFAAQREAVEVDEVPCRIASIGAATTRALRAVDMRADLQPPTATAESFAQALRPRAAGSRMLLVRAEVGRDVLPAELARAGAQVTVAHAYRTLVPSESVEALQRELPRLDAITFTSGSSVTNLMQLLDEAGLTLPPQLVLATIGPITTKALRDSGYESHLESSTADVEVFASELARHLNR